MGVLDMSEKVNMERIIMLHDMDIEQIYDILKHYEMVMSSQAIQIKLLEERINELEKSRKSPSGNTYENYYGDLSGR